MKLSDFQKITFSYKLILLFLPSHLSIAFKFQSFCCNNLFIFDLLPRASSQFDQLNIRVP